MSKLIIISSDIFNNGWSTLIIIDSVFIAYFRMRGTFRDISIDLDGSTNFTLELCVSNKYHPMKTISIFN